MRPIGSGDGMDVPPATDATTLVTTIVVTVVTTVAVTVDAITEDSS